MSAARVILEQKFAELLSWERRKRREDIFVTLVGYALLAALLALPLQWLLPARLNRWLLPIGFFALLAPWLFFRQRWRSADSARVLANLDKRLRLDERAITAWELLARNETRAAGLLVLKQAAERLKTLDPRALLPRRWGWQHAIVLPLLVLWFGLLWFEVDGRLHSAVQPPGAQTLAHKLRDFSRQLQEKAASEGLRESLRVGRELAQLAQQGIDAKAGDEQLKKALAGVAKKVEAAGKAAAERPSPSTAESQQSLKDLKAELEAAQELRQFSDAAREPRELGQQWLDRLATLPQIKKQLDQAGQALSSDQVKSFLDRLDQQVTNELDRRTLLDAQQFLDQLMKQGQGEKGENNVRTAGRGEQDSPGDGEKAKSNSNLPGKEPGKSAAGFQALPEFHAGAATQLKGQLGAGDSSGVVLKGKPSSGKSAGAQDEVIATYRRQAEQELNSERVPEALKETVRKYFLSLGEGNK